MTGQIDADEVRRAIPTRYANVRFRSRLEARWAAFFDLLGWPWEYEPLDLDGYIPDFLITPWMDPPALVEVKPIVEWPSGIEAEAFVKIRQSGWDGPSIIVGVSLMPAGELETPRIGRYYPAPSDLDKELPNGGCESFSRVFARCRRCPQIFLAQDISMNGPDGWEGFNNQRWCECDDSDRAAVPFDPTPLWRESGNRVQWRSPQ